MDSCWVFMQFVCQMTRYRMCCSRQQKGSSGSQKIGRNWQWWLRSFRGFLHTAVTIPCITLDATIQSELTHSFLTALQTMGFKDSSFKKKGKL